MPVMRDGTPSSARYRGGMSDARSVWGLGLPPTASAGPALAAWHPEVRSSAPSETEVAAARTALDAQTGPDERRDVTLAVVELTIDLDAAPTSTADAYLRLHALSHLLVRPNTLNLDGIFGHLPNVAWTNAGPLLPADAARLRPQLQRAGIQIQGLDKFPRLTDYAHLSPGTTVMHAGFVNFNAGTLGASMVEGRISQGVVVGDGSDIGGGASIMGTLSGGGSHRVSIGARTLLGANAGIGISLGDDCVVEAGLYVTAGTKIVLADGPATADGGRKPVKGADLSGQDGLLFRRNSLTGAVGSVRRAGVGVTLNEALHA